MKMFVAALSAGAINLSLRGIIVIAAAMLSSGAAFADTTSANATMPGCREFLVRDSRKEAWGQPYCVGVIVGLMMVSDNSCGPPNATTNQIIRVVVQYIDARPARMHEDFRKLALEALRAAWPC
jgi:hypothetical protein